MQEHSESLQLKRTWSIPVQTYGLLLLKCTPVNLPLVLCHIPRRLLCTAGES